MLQKIAAAMPFWAFFVESKVGKTGLTVAVDIWEKALGSAATEIVTSGVATEVGDGFYTYELPAASVDANGSYLAVFKTATTTVDSQHIPSAWFTPVWLTTVGAATVTFVNPLAADGTLTLVRGDDYYQADGRSMDYTFSGAPSLMGGTVKLTLRAANRGPIVYTGTVLSSTSARWELSAAQTGVLEMGDPSYVYDIQVALSGSGHIVTLQMGTVTVEQDVTP